MHGLLIIDKAQGLSSHAVVSRVRRLLNQRRVGHTGTLDPMATGVLPVAVGEGTRVIPFLHEEFKSYRASIRFGVSTDTQDAEGEVTARGDASHLVLEQVEAAIAGLSGDIDQLPPMYSALKRDGTPLYKLARKGEVVERTPRRITVHRWQLERFEDQTLECVIDCSRGTYIRTLAHDLGALLGCGAHLAALRRLRSGPFVIEQAISLEQLAGRIEGGEPLPWIGLREAIADRPGLELDEVALRRLLDGVPPSLDEVQGSLPDPEEEVALLYRGLLVAAARFAPGREREPRGDFELQRVFNQVREFVQ